MNIYEKIKKLCENDGFSISSIGDKIPGLSLNKSSVTGWKKGSVPRTKTLKTIAEYFGVPVDYFCNDEKAPTSDEPSGDGGIILSDAEKELLEKFRRLSAERQELAIQLLAPLEGGQ